MFVGNLPEEMDEEWMHQIFSGAGEVQDVYIPKKRSIFQNKKFGFVRYETKGEGFRAINLWNSATIRDHKLLVKFARFSDRKGHSAHVDKEKGSVQEHNHPIQPRFAETSNQGGEMQQKSDAQVLKGVENQDMPGKKRCIQIQPVGNGWLARSAVAKIRRLLSIEDLERVFTLQDIHNVKVKAIGGRYVIVIFSDQVVKSKIINENWLDNWFEEIKPWNGECAKDERFVWISCYGMPLNAWSVPTFKEIGSKWGNFIQVDENTLKGRSYDKATILIATEQSQKIEGVIELLVEGKIFNVRIQEDSSFRVVKSNTPDLFAIEEAVVDEAAIVEQHNDDMESNKVEMDANKNNMMDLNGKESKHALEDQLLHAPIATEMQFGETNEVIGRSCGFMEANEGNIEYSLHSLDSLVGLDSLVMESIAQSFQGRIVTGIECNSPKLVKDLDGEEESPAIDCDDVDESKEEVANSMVDMTDPIEVLGLMMTASILSLPILLSSMWSSNITRRKNAPNKELAGNLSPWGDLIL